MRIEPLIKIPKEVQPPGGADFFVESHTGRPPVFTAQEVARVFFARSKIWLYLQMRDGNHLLEGELTEIPRTRAGYQRFELFHVERMAHAFFSRDIITVKTFLNALLIVKTIADNYRIN